jgi:folate-binding protein YgfZ
MTTFWVPLQRDVITVHGADARTYLHSQLSQDIASMRVGDTRQSLLLQPTGKICGIVRVTCIDGETFLLDCDSGTGEAVLVRLNRFKIRVKAELSLGRETWTAVRNVTAPVDGAIPAWKGDGSAWDFRGDLSDTSIPQGTQEDYETARICSSWPVMHIDVTESSIPAECGLTDVAVSFSKGCYPGQELVERMDSRSAVAPRQLRYTTVEEGTLVGQEVRDEERIGVITSVCGCHALALFRRA